MSYTTDPTPIPEDTSFNLQWTDDNGQFDTSYTYKLTIFNESTGQGDEVTTSATNANEINFNNVMGLSYGSYTVNVSQYYPTDGTYNKYGTPLSVTCFVEGSEILCVVNNKEEYIKVEDLKQGDLVKTYNNTPKKVLHVIKKKFINHKSYSQICKLSGYPNQTKDLYLTGGHSILVDKLTDQQNNKTIEIWGGRKKVDDKYRLLCFVDENNEKIEDNKEYNVYHIVLENSDPKGQYGIYANGILTETMSIRWYLKSTRFMVGKKKSETISKKMRRPISKNG